MDAPEGLSAAGRAFMLNAFGSDILQASGATGTNPSRRPRPENSSPPSSP
ncbi:hypothetical protein ACWFR1_24390 [Streptomyces sp. NPDC055103]